MAMFRVDGNCLKCGLCAELCAARIIGFEKERTPWVAPEAESRCIRCGQCVSFCPVRACWLSFQPEEDRRPVERDWLPTPEAAETLLRSRRSVRRYRAETLDRAMILRLLDTARYAPSAGNRQPVRWIVTESRERTLALAALVIRDFEREIAASADPAGHPLAPVAAAGRAGDVIMRGAPHLAVAVVPADYPFPEDAAMALTYFELAAHANGVGCCWAGYFTLAARRSPELKAALGVSGNEMAVGGQMFGRPDGLSLCRLLPPRKKPDLSWL